MSLTSSPVVGSPWPAGGLPANKELASAAFNARVIPSVAYTDPEVAWVGLTVDQAKAQGFKVKKACFPGRHQAAPSPMAVMKE